MQAAALAADPGNARLAARLSELWRGFRTVNDFYLELKDEICFPQVAIGGLVLWAVGWTGGVGGWQQAPRRRAHQSAANPALPTPPTPTLCRRSRHSSPDTMPRPWLRMLRCGSWRMRCRACWQVRHGARLGGTSLASLQRTRTPVLHLRARSSRCKCPHAAQGCFRPALPPTRRALAMPTPLLTLRPMLAPRWRRSSPLLRRSTSACGAAGAAAEPIGADWCPLGSSHRTDLPTPSPPPSTLQGGGGGSLGMPFLH